MGEHPDGDGGTMAPVSRPHVPQPVARPSARVLAVGPGDVLLLMHMRGSHDLYWLTPGGGVQPGEKTADAAARELLEETGIQVSPDELGAVVATSAGQWSAAGTVYAAHDSFFCVRVDDTDVRTDGREDLERSLITGHRWWTLPELEATQERVVPPGLAGLMRSFLAGEPHPSPVRLPWPGQ